MTLSFLGKYREGGLLFLRVGIGALFICHGLPMVMGGPGHWHEIGTMAMKPVGLHSYLTIWGAVAAFSEFIGGILMVIGLFFRPACIFLALTMTIATAMHMKHHDNFNTATSHAAEMAVVFYSLILIGPGKHSVDKN